MLYVIPTPIGNLSDMTYRSIETIQSADILLCEDTRVTSKLLNHYDIKKPLQAFHAHNEHYVLKKYIDLLKAGNNIALMSDAGTPGISDPGFLLIREARHHDIEVTVLPGATAIIPAIVGSGIPCDKFHFEGFLPIKKGRKTRLEYLCSLPHSFVLYVSPHKLLKDIDSLIEHCGEDRVACIVKEISKIFETYDLAQLSELKHKWSEKKIKGEYVMVISGT